MKKIQIDEIVIIILNYSNYNLTKNAVNNLLLNAIKYPIVIVDNNSPNESYSILKDYYSDNTNIHVIQTKNNGGYSKGNNFGIKYAESKYKNLKYICIMNPDIELKDSKIIDNLILLLNSSSQYASATGIQILNGQKVHGWELPSYLTLIFKESILFNKLNFMKKRMKEKVNESILEQEVLSGCFFVINKEIFKDIGYFDENVFLYFEEDILSHKLMQRGWKSVIDLNQSFYHNHNHKKSRTLKSLLKDYSIFVESKKYYCNKYMKKKPDLLFYISAIFHKYVELPLKYLIKYKIGM
ncbi:glycosyltransferase [Bacillus sp. Marseille-Q1617]|uniref:glycosyltransferase n=1 Tax=Bacillus sp. Marseille-Q1617 TaxID=2736887 RepID=UPI00158DA4EE|nr:glycosyltransferase family 2 protein [Bacillus sp. Marseille-Q1617]